MRSFRRPWPQVGVRRAWGPDGRPVWEVSLTTRAPVQGEWTEHEWSGRPAGSDQPPPEPHDAEPHDGEPSLAERLGMPRPAAEPPAAGEGLFVSNTPPAGTGKPEVWVWDHPVVPASATVGSAAAATAGDVGPGVDSPGGPLNPPLTVRVPFAGLSPSRPARVAAAPRADPGPGVGDAAGFAGAGGSGRPVRFEDGELRIAEYRYRADEPNIDFSEPLARPDIGAALIRLAVDPTSEPLRKRVVSRLAVVHGWFRNAPDLDISLARVGADGSARALDGVFVWRARGVSAHPSPAAATESPADLPAGLPLQVWRQPPAGNHADTDGEDAAAGEQAGPVAFSYVVVTDAAMKELLIEDAGLIRALIQLTCPRPGDAYAGDFEAELRKATARSAIGTGTGRIGRPASGASRTAVVLEVANIDGPTVSLDDLQVLNDGLQPDRPAAISLPRTPADADSAKQHGKGGAINGSGAVAGTRSAHTGSGSGTGVDRNDLAAGDHLDRVSRPDPPGQAKRDSERALSAELAELARKVGVHSPRPAPPVKPAGLGTPYLLNRNDPGPGSLPGSAPR